MSCWARTCVSVRAAFAPWKVETPACVVKALHYLAGVCYRKKGVSRGEVRLADHNGAAAGVPHINMTALTGVVALFMPRI